MYLISYYNIKIVIKFYKYKKYSIELTKINHINKN